MLLCANQWRKFILEAGADKCEVMESQGNPVVYAEKINFFRCTEMRNIRNPCVFG